MTTLTLAVELHRWNTNGVRHRLMTWRSLAN
ncbi:hypothetical protein J3D47_003052 [Pseudomonas laurylsulfativorans]|nr:hypothetical protein [Pseudomonas laurylsulfativorans]